MSRRALDQVFRSASARIVGALAAHYRDLDLAEEAFGEACLRASRAWAGTVPANPEGWLYRVGQRCAVDALRKRRVREAYVPELDDVEASPEDVMLDDAMLIPDERLRLIFVSCHPAVAPDARAALTLRVVCGLSTAEIAHAFLLSEPALAQRLVRAKRKIAEAGVPFEIPGPQLWVERLDAVLSTIEVAYSKAHEDAAAAGPHASYATEVLNITRLLTELLPEEADVLALAALVRFAEARRPARVDENDRMIPLSEQDPQRWDRAMIATGDSYLKRALALGSSTPRLVEAGIHAVWCQRRGLDEPAPWARVLELYNGLLLLRDDPVVRLNRAVAIAEVHGAEAALAELRVFQTAQLESFAPFKAVEADLLRRTGQFGEARRAYEQAIELQGGTAEAAWLEQQLASIGDR